MNDWLRLILLQDANTRVVMLGTASLGFAAGVSGCYALLRRRALLGDALAHAALPGIALAFLIVGERNLAAFVVGALVLGLAAAGTVWFIRTFTRVKDDAAMGLALGCFFGLGLVLTSYIQSTSGHAGGLNTYLFGKAATLVAADLWLILTALAVVTFTVLSLGRWMDAVCFDEAFARSIGVPTRAVDLAIVGLIAVVTVAGLPAVGVVLIVALLIIPAAAARLWTHRVAVMVPLAGVLGAVAAVVGTSASAVQASMPTGPAIVLAAGAAFLLSLLASPRDGLIVRSLRRRRFARNAAVQHLLRAVFEVSERRSTSHLHPTDSHPGPRGPDPSTVARADLLLNRAWSAASLDRAILLASRQALVSVGADGSVTLTSAGRDQALRTVRAHRLWELYLINSAAIKADHVDRDADELEHLLPPDLLSQLEQQATDAPIPASPHLLSAAPATSQRPRDESAPDHMRGHA